MKKKKIKLSILICTLKSREKLLSQLLDVINEQKTDEVEILINSDEGEKKIGTKRNELLEKANGEYVCFVDDDDTITYDYVSSILNCLKKSPDAVGIELNYYQDNKLIGIAYHSSKNDSWFEKKSTKDAYIMEYYRTINHLNPIKREIALKVKFPEINDGEDYDFSIRLAGLINSEEYINHPIYNYYFDSIKNIDLINAGWMAKLYDMFFNYIEVKHKDELIQILMSDIDKTDKHSKCINFIQKVYNEFLVSHKIREIDPGILAVPLVVMNTISVQIEKSDK